MKFILKKPKQNKTKKITTESTHVKIKIDGNLTRVKLVKKTSFDMHSSKLCMMGNIYFILNTFMFLLNGIQQYLQ